MPISASPSTSDTTALLWVLAETMPPPTAVPSSATTQMRLDTSSVHGLHSFDSISITTPALAATAPPTDFTGHSYGFSLSGSRMISSVYTQV